MAAIAAPSTRARNLPKLLPWLRLPQAPTPLHRSPPSLCDLRPTPPLAADVDSSSPLSLRARPSSSPPAAATSSSFRSTLAAATPSPLAPQLLLPISELPSMASSPPAAASLRQHTRPPPPAVSLHVRVSSLHCRSPDHFLLRQRQLSDDLLYCSSSSPSFGFMHATCSMLFPNHYSTIESMLAVIISVPEVITSVLEKDLAMPRTFVVAIASCCLHSWHSP